MDDIQEDTDLISLSRTLKVIAEPKRLEILALLMQGVQCNCELGDKLNMTPNLISHHLRVLYEADMINMERDPVDARWIYYSINQSKASELIIVLKNFLDTSLIQPRSLDCGPHSKSTFKKSNKLQTQKEELQ